MNRPTKPSRNWPLIIFVAMTFGGLILMSCSSQRPTPKKPVVPQRSMAPMTTLTFKPDSSVVTAGHSDGTVTYWFSGSHERDGHPPAKLCNAPIASLSYESEGLTLFGLDDQGRFNSSTGMLENEFSGDKLDALVATQQGLAVAQRGETSTSVFMVLREADADGRLRQLALPAPDSQARPTKINALAYAAGADRLIAAGNSGFLFLWDKGKRPTDYPALRPQGNVLDVSITPDGAYAASISDNRFVDIWDLKEGEHKGEILVKNRPRHVAISPDHTLVAVSYTNHPTEVYNFEDRTKNSGILTARAPVVAIAFSPDGKQFVEGTKTGGPVFHDLSNVGIVIPDDRP